MPAKIRLARHGRKARPYYHIVVADSRAPRDGRFIERIGSYNPMTDPATVTLDFEKAIQWLNNGAIPTETVESILRREGVLYRRHLMKGVAKGAFTTEVMEQRFAEWKAKNDAKKQAYLEKKKKSLTQSEKARLENERKKNEERLAKIAAAKAQKAAEAAQGEAESSEEN
ncbi:MAG TPA: 30S ribosomal protein S16 [Salinivirgaceae bacterium]|nr:30S ribosomal protein S16 [Salinivirgaceae bacterium]